MSNAALKSTGAATDLPRRKVAVGGLAGAVSVILIYVVNHYFLNAPSEALPGDVGAAITLAISFAVSWFMPPSDDETTIADPAVKQLPAGPTPA
ncbi:hypothetical protein KX816_06410 [Sphingosinicellaceae bacterium]|nr:hypothetical protein KX816_06410 [Sphingosinicellaceae bacterium]